MFSQENLNISNSSLTFSHDNLNISISILPFFLTRILTFEKGHQLFITRILTFEPIFIQHHCVFLIKNQLVRAIYQFRVNGSTIFSKPLCFTNQKMSTIIILFSYIGYIAIYRRSASGGQSAVACIGSIAFICYMQLQLRVAAR